MHFRSPDSDKDRNLEQAEAHLDRLKRELAEGELCKSLCQFVEDNGIDPEMSIAEWLQKQPAKVQRVKTKLLAEIMAHVRA
jgi:hypothetical protein